MRQEPLAVILTSDLVGQCRGRAMRQSELEYYMTKGCGWVPGNMALNPFGEIVEPNAFGSVGDQRLRPDPDSLSAIFTKAEKPTQVVLSDIVNPDGTPWDCCPRTFLRNAIADLKAETGLSVISSFEHEFMLKDTVSSEPNIAFSLKNLLEREPLGSTIMAALEDAGLEPEMWLPEYSPDQWEVTLRPTNALAAADRAILLREIVRNAAFQLGHDATFSPIVEPDGGGNGVHVHVSLQDESGDFVTYDPTKPGNLSDRAGSFAAGILKHAHALTALAASSVISYERLAPGRWSVGGSFLGENNRESILRICPLFASAGSDPKKQYNLEFRAADATSNPWIILGALIRAGLEGIRAKLPSPTVVSGDISGLTSEERNELRIEALPSSLEDAMERLAGDETARGWFSPRFFDTLMTVKAAEVEYIAALEGDERYAHYSSVY